MKVKRIVEESCFGSKVNGLQILLTDEESKSLSGICLQGCLHPPKVDDINDDAKARTLANDLRNVIEGLIRQKNPQEQANSLRDLGTH